MDKNSEGNLQNLYDEIITEFSGQRLSGFILDNNKSKNIVDEVIQTLKIYSNAEGESRQKYMSNVFLEQLYELKRKMEW